MSIAYLVSKYPAPSHTFISREIEALRAHGIDIKTFSIRRPSNKESMSDKDQAEFESTWFALPPSLKELGSALIWAAKSRPLKILKGLWLSLHHRPPGLRALIFAFIYWLEAVMLSRQLVKHEIRHLHNHFANPAAIVGLIASRILDMPWSLTLHGISEFDYPAGLLLHDKIAAAKFVACVSYFGRAQAFRVADPAHWDKLKIVRCGLNMSEIPADIDQQTNRRARIICVARFSAEKGHIGLLQAFAQQRKAGMDAELCLIGDGPERGRIEQEVDRLGIRDDCKFLGILPSERVFIEVQNSDLLVMSSFMEGLPIVLMEAFALGIAVVAPRVAGIPELVDESCGLMFTPGNWQEMGEAIASLISDPARRKRCGEVGRQRIHQEFDIMKAVAPLLSEFKSS